VHLNGKMMRLDIANRTKEMMSAPRVLAPPTRTPLSISLRQQILGPPTLPPTLPPKLPQKPSNKKKIASSRPVERKLTPYVLKPPRSAPIFAPSYSSLQFASRPDARSQSTREKSTAEDAKIPAQMARTSMASKLRMQIKGLPDIAQTLPSKEKIASSEAHKPAASTEKFASSRGSKTSNGAEGASSKGCKSPIRKKSSSGSQGFKLPSKLR